jgi:hypothetical protein
MYHVGKKFFSKNQKKNKEFGGEVFGEILTRTSRIVMPDESGNMLRNLKRPLM